MIEKGVITLFSSDADRLIYACANYTHSDKKHPLFYDRIVQIYFDRDRLDIGVCYTSNSFGGRLREVSDAEKEQIKSTHYDKHHEQFNDLVAEEIEENGRAFIVDCHSFSNEVLPHEENIVRPDICIGTDAFHAPSDLLQKVSHYFKDEGYTVAVNQPFAGTIVPLKYYRKDQRVSSIMIEINRNLYLGEDFEKNEQFRSIRLLIGNMLKSFLNQT